MALPAASALLSSTNVKSEKTHWVVAIEAWRKFVQAHPELGYRDGVWQFRNFLRVHKQQLVQQDVIRMAKRRYWIAQLPKFIEAAFDSCTGVVVRTREDTSEGYSE